MSGWSKEWGPRLHTVEWRRGPVVRFTLRGKSKEELEDTRSGGEDQTTGQTRRTRGEGSTSSLRDITSPERHNIHRLRKHKERLDGPGVAEQGVKLTPILDGSPRSPKTLAYTPFLWTYVGVGYTPSTRTTGPQSQGDTDEPQSLSEVSLLGPTRRTTLEPV